MVFTIRATDSGKMIRIVDRIAQSQVFDQFVDLNATNDVTVASQDGQTGLVDIWYAITGPANTIWGSSPNTVSAGQTLNIDGQ
jgi:hypothetical protein